MGLILERSQDSVWIFSTSVEARVILDPVPGVGRKGLLHFHEAATLDRTGVYASGGFCDLVPPGILPEVEVPGPGVHVVDSNRVKVVEGDERIPEITSRRVDESRVDGIALLNLLVDGHGHWVAPVVVSGTRVELQPHKVEGWPCRDKDGSRNDWCEWSGWGQRSRCKGRCSSIENWALGSVLLLNTWLLLLLGTILLLRCCIDSGHQGSHVSGNSGVLILHLLLKGHKVGLLLGPFCLLLSKKVHHPSWRLLLASSGAVLGIVVVHSGCFLIDELLETFPESLVSCRGAPRLGKTEVERCGGGVVQTRIDTLEVSYE